MSDIVVVLYLAEGKLFASSGCARDVSDNAHPLFCPLNEIPMKMQLRFKKFAPNGVPKNINVYDNGGETHDRITVVFKNLRFVRAGQERWFPFVACSSTNILGHEESRNKRVDYPSYGHLGKKVKDFNSLSLSLRQQIWHEYAMWFDIPKRRVTE